MERPTRKIMEETLMDFHANQEIAETMTNCMCKTNHAMFQMWIDSGFTREEAFDLIKIVVTSQWRETTNEPE